MPNRELNTAEMMITFRTNVRALMDLEDMTTKDLADKSGVGRDALYKFFQNRSSNISTADAAKIATVFNTSVDYLIGSKATKTLEIAHLLDQLSAQEREFALIQLKALSSRGQEGN